MSKSEITRRAVKEVLEKDENVLLAYLFGSAARGTTQPISDVDVAVLLRDNSLERQADILWRIAKALHVPEDRIDIVDLSRAGLHLKYSILREGAKLVDRGLEEGLARELVERYPEARESLDIALMAWLREDPSVDRAVVSRRLDEILKNAALIRERYARRPLQWILADLERTLALERALERIVEAMTDACRHIVSAKRLGLIETRAEYPLRLAQHRLMPKGLAEKIAGLIKLRNILAHRYLEIDYAKLHVKAREAAEEVAPLFAEWARELLSSEAAPKQ